MNRLTIAIGLALFAHLALFIVPLDIRIGAPMEAANRQVINLSLASHANFSPEPVHQKTPMMPEPKEIAGTRPKILSRPDPVPASRHETAMANDAPSEMSSLIDTKNTTIASVDPDIVDTDEDESLTEIPDPPELIENDTSQDIYEHVDNELLDNSADQPSVVSTTESDTPATMASHSPPPTEEIPNRISLKKGSIIKAVPRYRENPTPVYPRLAKRRGYQGTVILDVRIDAEGKVEALKINRSSGFPMLDQSAEITVRNWRFVPGRYGDRPIEMWVRVPVKFMLN